MHTGYVPSGSVKHPNLGSAIAKEIGTPDHDLPSVVSIGRTIGAGFLGVDYEPFAVQNPGQMPVNVTQQVKTDRFSRRLGVLNKLEEPTSHSEAARRWSLTIDDCMRRRKTSSSVLKRRRRSISPTSPSLSKISTAAANLAKAVCSPVDWWNQVSRLWKSISVTGILTTTILSVSRPFLSNVTPVSQR